jgi:hypothetical protein
MDKIKFTGRHVDPFSHSARWDSVGLDCEFCKHINSNDWPNEDSEYSCRLHAKSLRIEIGDRGYKVGEWFCSKFEDNGRSHPKSLAEFENTQFEDDKLYCIGWQGEDLFFRGF